MTDTQQLRVSFLDDWAASYNKECECRRGLKQLYYCDVVTCPDHHSLKFFCTDCVIINNRHNHAPRVPIKEELEKRMQEWMAVSEGSKDLKSIIDSNYP